MTAQQQVALFHHQQQQQQQQFRNGQVSGFVVSLFRYFATAPNSLNPLDFYKIYGKCRCDAKRESIFDIFG